MNREPAAPVPTLVLTEETAGTPVLAEVGDRVEVRLREAADTNGRWQLLERTGDAVNFIGDRVEAAPDAPGGQRLPPMRLFRFSAAAVGRSELVFGQGSRSVRFVVEVR